jgi:glycosyltransferase involved in cell wall biosynthesis
MYNSSRVIEHTLNSLTNLDYPKDLLEVIAVDDGSTDDTILKVRKWIDEKGKDFYEVKIIELKKNYGVSRARNIGIINARGKYIMLLDSDVSIKPGTIKLALETLKRCNESCVVSMFPVGDPPSLEEKLIVARFLNKVASVNGGPFFTGCAFIPRKVIDRVGLFNEKLGYPYALYEDWEYGVRCNKAGIKVLIDGRVVQEHLTRYKKVANENQSIPPNHRQKLYLLLNALLSRLISYLRPNKTYALIQVLKSAPLKIKIEYAVYVFMSYFIMLSLFIAPLINLLLFFSMLVLYSLYYFCNFAIKRYVLIYSLIALIVRLLRGFSLLIYIFINIIKSLKSSL